MNVARYARSQSKASVQIRETLPNPLPPAGFEPPLRAGSISPRAPSEEIEMLTLNAGPDIYAAANAEEFSQAAKPALYEIVDALHGARHRILSLAQPNDKPPEQDILNHVVHRELRPTAQQVNDLKDAMAYHQPAKAATINELRRILNGLKAGINEAIAAEISDNNPDHRQRIIELAGRTGALAHSARMLGHKLPAPPRPTATNRP